jgi:hypothetical protein
MYVELDEERVDALLAERASSHAPDGAIGRGRPRDLAGHEPGGGTVRPGGTVPPPRQGASTDAPATARIGPSAEAGIGEVSASHIRAGYGAYAALHAPGTAITPAPPAARSLSEPPVPAQPVARRPDPAVNHVATRR